MFCDLGLGKVNEQDNTRSLRVKLLAYQCYAFINSLIRQNSFIYTKYVEISPIF